MSGFSKLHISSEAFMRIHAAGPGPSSDAAFDLEVRGKLSRATYQAPDDIADGVRLISPIELWIEVAKHHGAIGAGAKSVAASLKLSLTQIATRRNKIVHEGDLQPGSPRLAWPISRQDVDEVKSVILTVVAALEAVV